MTTQLPSAATMPPGSTRTRPSATGPLTPVRQVASCRHGSEEAQDEAGTDHALVDARRRSVTDEQASARGAKSGMECAGCTDLRLAARLVVPTNPDTLLRMERACPCRLWPFAAPPPLRERERVVPRRRNQGVPQRSFMELDWPRRICGAVRFGTIRKR